MHSACSLGRSVGITELDASVSFSSEDQSEEPQAEKHRDRCKNSLEDATGCPYRAGCRASGRIFLLTAAAKKPDYSANHRYDKNDLSDRPHDFSFQSG